MSDLTVGVIGIGAMGLPMAARLHQAGFGLVIADQDQALVAQFCADHPGAKSAQTAKELASQSDYVITMLPNSQIVEQVLSGPDGVLAGLRPGAHIIDMTSGVPQHTQRLSEQVREAGGVMLDAPVSGGVLKAREGTLAIMVGGEDKEVAQVRPVLEALGASILHTGAVGSGHAMKALNNLLSAGGFLLGIEVLSIGQKFGLDPAVMVDALNASTGVNNSTQKKFKQFVLSRKFDSGFSLELMVKDLGIALGIAEGTGTSAPFSALCEQLWCASRNLLPEGADHTASAQFVEAINQLTLGQP